MDLHHDLTDLLGALVDSSAEFLVVGGWAVSFHSEPRFTKDLDLLVGTDDANLLRVVTALEQFGAPSTILEQAKALGPDEFIFFGTPPARVDILRSIPGILDFEAAYARATLGTLQSIPVPIIALDDLIEAKRAAGRPRDLRDLEALLRTRDRR